MRYCWRIPMGPSLDHRLGRFRMRSSYWTNCIYLHAKPVAAPTIHLPPAAGATGKWELITIPRSMPLKQRPAAATAGTDHACLEVSRKRDTLYML